MIKCQFCEKEFSNKSNLKIHQNSAKYCLDLQGKHVEEFKCEFCLKISTTQRNLNEHILTCKKKIKIESENMVEKMKKSVDRLERKTEKLREEYEKKLEKLREEYEEKLEKQKREYERKLEKYEEKYEQRIDRHESNMIAMKPNNHTNNHIVNHTNNTLNFNDKELLNNVISSNVNKDIIERGQEGFASVLYQKYLKDGSGKLLYNITDASRQNFEYIDEKGELKTDLGAKKLTEAVSQSNLTRVVSGIAKDINDIFENKEKFEKVSQLTEFDKDNSKFRKEIVRLTKSKT